MPAEGRDDRPLCLLLFDQRPVDGHDGPGQHEQQRLRDRGGETTFGESLTKVDSAPATRAVVHVAAPHDEIDRVAPFAEAAPLVRSSRPPILRI